MGAIARERTEEELLRSERRYRTLAEATTEAIFVHRDGRVTDVNDRAAALLRASREELTGLSVLDDLVPADRAVEIRQRIADGELLVYESEVLTRDGERVPVQVSGRQYEEAGDQIRIAALRDIRDRLYAEERLEEAALRMRNLVETTFEGYVVSRRGFVLEASPGFARMCGYEPHEVLGMMPADVTTAEGAATIRDNIVNQVRSPYVVTGVRKDGSTFPMLIQGTETTFGGEEVRITGFRDVTQEQERDRLEERVRQAQKLESLGLLAGGIAHDFNNLLVGMLGNAELALDTLPRGSEERELVEQIHLASLRASDLVGQMLAYAGRVEPRREAVPLAPLIRELGDLLQASFPARTQITWTLPSGLHPVLGDASQLRQVVMNVVQNAAEAAAEGGGHVRIGLEAVRLAASPPDLVTPTELSPGDYLVLEVADDGPGMDETVLSQMFDPFFSTKFAGRGLGLAAVLGIPNGHQGAMTVRSVKGQGTVFSIYLPAAQDRTPPPGEQPDRPASPQRRSWTVLVVDDDDGVRLVASSALGRAGHRVVTATNGTDGMAEFFAHEAEVDAVLLDVTMPGLPSEELFAIIRRARPEVPVLFSSGQLEPLLAGDLTDEPHVAFLHKPWRLSALMEQLTALIEG